MTDARLFLGPRPRAAAMRRLAASSVAPVPPVFWPRAGGLAGGACSPGYEHSLRPCDARISLARDSRSEKETR